MVNKMSKERELLARVLESRTFMQGVALRREIEQLLAQPDHITDSRNMVEQGVADLKREPLSDGTTADMWHSNKKATHADSYWAGVSDAEKAHDIGVS